MRDAPDATRIASTFRSTRWSTTSSSPGATISAPTALAIALANEAKVDNCILVSDGRQTIDPIAELGRLALDRGVGQVMAALKAQGVPTMVYYTKSMHQQTAYKAFPVADGGLPVSEQLSDDVISLPIHAYLNDAAQDRVLRDALARRLRFGDGGVFGLLMHRLRPEPELAPYDRVSRRPPAGFSKARSARLGAAAGARR